VEPSPANGEAIGLPVLLEAVTTSSALSRGQDLSGEWSGGLSAPGASAEPRPLARGRGRAAAARRLPRFAEAGGCSPLGGSPAPCVAESVRVARPTVPAILSRQTHWHLSGWTGQT
jgi:hypothetical protein